MTTKELEIAFINTDNEQLSDFYYELLMKKIYPSKLQKIYSYVYNKSDKFIIFDDFRYYLKVRPNSYAIQRLYNDIVVSEIELSKHLLKQYLKQYE